MQEIEIAQRLRRIASQHPETRETLAPLLKKYARSPSPLVRAVVKALKGDFPTVLNVCAILLREAGFPQTANLFWDIRGNTQLAQRGIRLVKRKFQGDLFWMGPEIAHLCGEILTVAGDPGTAARLQSSLRREDQGIRLAPPNEADIGVDVGFSIGRDLTAPDLLRDFVLSMLDIADLDGISRSMSESWGNPRSYGTHFVENALRKAFRALGFKKTRDIASSPGLVLHTCIAALQAAKLPKDAEELKKLARNFL